MKRLGRGGQMGIGIGLLLFRALSGFISITAIFALGIYFKTTFEIVLLFWAAVMVWLICRTAMIVMADFWRRTAR
jgi:hypothetical protein